MRRHIEVPEVLHLKIVDNIIEKLNISYEKGEGYTNAKDFQIECLFQYE